MPGEPEFPAEECTMAPETTLDAITWPVRTDRLTLRAATPDDLFKARLRQPQPHR